MIRWVPWMPLLPIMVDGVCRPGFKCPTDGAVSMARLGYKPEAAWQEKHEAHCIAAWSGGALSLLLEARDDWP